MRYVKWSIVTLAVVLIIIYYAGGYLTGRWLETKIANIQPQLEEQGIEIKEFGFGKVNIYSFNSISIRDVILDFNLEREIYGKKSFNAQFKASSVIAGLVSLKDPSISLELNDFDLLIQPNEDNPNRPFGRFENAFWSGETPLQLYDLKESGSFIVKKLNTLFRENSIPEPIEFRADALLNLDGQIIRIRMFTERVDNRTYLRFKPEDILKAAEDFEDVDISIQEAELISQYPARALHIIKITRDAWRLTRREKSASEDFPADAFKHVYWSYHLTRTFGPDFAKMITDAHETLPNNTPAQRKMDFHNNEFGRKLAVRDLSVGELREIVLGSPGVIRFPDQI